MASTSSTAIFLLFLISTASVLPSYAGLLDRVGTGLGGVLGGVGTGVSGVLGPGLGGVLGTVIGSGVGGTIPDIGTGVGGVLGGVGTGVGGGLGGVGTGTGGALGGVGTGTGGVLGGIGTGVSGVLGPGLGGVLGSVLGSGVGGVILDVGSEVGGVKSGVGGVVGPGLGGVLGVLGGFVGSLLEGIQVSGLLSCSATGNPGLGTVGLPGVNVTVICIGLTTSIASGITDTNGKFIILVDLTSAIVIGTSSLPTCVATVQLPVANCSLLPLTGILQAQVNLTANVILDVLGLVIQAFIGLFVPISI